MAMPPYLTSSGLTYKYITSTGSYEITTETPAPVIVISPSGQISIITSTGLELTSGQLPDAPQPPVMPVGVNLTFDSDSSLFYPKMTVSMTGVATGLPIDFSFPGVDLNEILGFPGTPEIPISMGSGPFDFGLRITFICPGYPVCGAKTACRSVQETPTYNVDPSQWFSFKIPGIPAMPKLPKIPGFTYSVPPKHIMPQGCPNYIRSQQNAADKGGA